MTTPVLAGWTVGITAARRREELGGALERRGARVVYGPAIRIVPLADDTRLLAATERCLAAPLDLTVATTGIGFRGWLDAAETWGLAEPLTAALARSTILARGPKVRGAVRAGGLREAWSPESESSAEVLAHLLANHELAGRRVAVQLHGEPLRELVDTLRDSGADVIEVPVYRWEPPEDEQPLLRLVESVAAGAVDALTFTSAPAAVNFLRTADGLGRGEDVRAALRGPVLCAAVGPVTGAPLQAAGLPVVQPERFRLGALVREVVEQLPRRATVLTLAGHRVELRGQAAVVDDDLVPLAGSAMAMLRALAADPGRVLGRGALGQALPGGAGDGHAVEVAVGRLRTALGDPAIVQTVVKRGYRLNLD
ncbi:uroporphyrinogen-III synthase [Jatrophihabitans endophyticus]|uniref:Uroporphyrinogen-III synthase n=1 Tax=Jatrophihabitans endophyticus TaxID=1206085 RepID=A0A1M5T1N5_9ACTN|nr:uroporphyrinogen-III synthase [Jatrophihabitans endophyticus]SHH44582.1 uroporphyrinogen-III synthase [Jatrophihabitans endophyticus]